MKSVALRKKKVNFRRENNYFSPNRFVVQLEIALKSKWISCFNCSVLSFWLKTFSFDFDFFFLLSLVEIVCLRVFFFAPHISVKNILQSLAKHKKNFFFLKQPKCFTNILLKVRMFIFYWYFLLLLLKFNWIHHWFETNKICLTDKSKNHLINVFIKFELKFADKTLSIEYISLTFFITKNWKKYDFTRKKISEYHFILVLNIIWLIS